MLTTGNQLKAARALAGMDQGELARKAGVNINTISAMEKRGAETLTSGLDKIKAVMSVLEAAGIEFLNHGQPGVRMKLILRDQAATLTVGQKEIMFSTLAEAIIEFDRLPVEDQKQARMKCADGWALAESDIRRLPRK